MAFCIASTTSPTPSASAPPEPPSPRMTTTIGVWSRAISRIDCAIASACPRSSPSGPGYAPGVSTKVMSGRWNFSASRYRRIAFRYPSGCGIPKLRAMFSSGDAPFCSPTMTTGRPSRSAIPPTIAGSSRKPRSPCSSLKRSKTRPMISSVCGRWMLRAACTASHGLARDTSCAGSVMRFASTGRWPLPSTVRLLPTRRSSIDNLEAPPQVLRCRAERRQEERQPLAQLRPRHDLVDEAPLEEELRLPESRRQLLTDGPTRHAFAGETDERAGLGEDDVPERRVRREDAARGGVGDDAHVGQASLIEPRERSEDLRHLHQRDRAFLHACATRRRHDHQRSALRQRALGGAGDLLANDRAHRAAHELEVHDGEDHRVVPDRRLAGDDRVLLAALRLRGRDALRVGFAVGEAERI